MRVLVIENYPKTTLGLVGEALDEAGAECRIVRTHARRRACPPRTTASTRSSCSAARRTRSTTRTIPTFRDEVGAGPRLRRRRTSRCSASASARSSSPAPMARRTSSGGRSNSAGTRCAPTEAGRADPVLSAIGGGAPLFHWHVDTFTLPPGAVHLAESDMTQMQAFRIGRAVYGIQFHFEAGTELVASWNARLRRRDRADYAPDWFERHPAEAARHGAAADAAGLALARAWVGLDPRRPSPSRGRPARTIGKATFRRGPA